MYCAVFDHYFDAHPLVRYHAYERGRYARRISDSVAFSRFRRSALYHDYYRRVGMDHAVALPVYVDRRWLVSFVLNRTGRDFSDRDCARLDLLRDTLGTLYRKSRLIAELRAQLRAEVDDTGPTPPAAHMTALLTDQVLARLGH